MTVRFVGRERPRAELSARLDDARAGRGGAVLVTGEAGLGKSALVDEVRAEAASAGVPTLVGRCTADRGAPPFWPWPPMLAHARGLDPHLLDTSGAGPGRSAPNPVAARFAAIHRTTEALISAAAANGLLIAIDDLQWADDDCLALIRHLVAEAAATRVLLVGTVRDALPEPVAAPTLRLAPMRPDEVSAYLRAYAEDVDPSWADDLYRRSGGNPLFLRELTRFLAGEGRLGGPAGDYALPAELRRLLALRMAHVSDPCQRMLGVASAIGDEVDLTLLRAVVDEPAAVAEAVDAGILVADPAGPTRLRFSHGLVREARYDLAGRDERVGWHARIADACGDLAVRARHRVRAAVDAPTAAAALADCRAAGADAARRVAPDAAVYWYGQALPLVGAEAERADVLIELAEALYLAGRADTALERTAEALAIAERAGDADRAGRAALVVRDLGGTPNATIAALCERALAVPGGPAPTVRARVLARQSMALAELGDHDRATELAAEAMATADPLADGADAIDARIDALHARHTTIAGQPMIGEQLDIANRLRELAATAGRPEAALWAHLWRVDATMVLGAIGELDREVAALDTAVERLGWPLGRWHLARVRAAVASRAGEFDVAAAHAGRAYELARSFQDESGLYLYVSFMSDLRWLTGRFDEQRPMIEDVAGRVTLPIADAIFGQMLWAMGDTDAARIRFDRLRALVAGLPPTSIRLPILAATGELAAAFGDADTARTCYDRLLPYRAHFLSSASGVRGACPRSLGLMAAGFGDLDAADRLLGEAVTMEDRTGSVGFHALALYEHARMLTGRAGPGDRERAAGRCERALLIARRIRMDRVATAAAALGDELSGVRPGAGTLTAREREITALVADGLTNRLIADRLVLSERTVETHVRAALAKIGGTNRAQLTAWALRNLRTESR
jgi:DNA-binding CsgD family transcriptional regulator